MKRRVRNALLAVLTLAMLAATGCTSGTQSQQGAQRQLVIGGATASPPTMDPTANDAAAIPQVLLYNVYETLVKMDSTGQLRPLLAQRWDLSTDRLTYTFLLDPGAKFASGRPVTAADVVWSIQRAKNDVASTTIKRQMALVESATATGERTVEVKLTRPSNGWLFDMSSTAGIVIDSQAQVDLASQPAGSGPFKLKQWTQAAR